MEISISGRGLLCTFEKLLPIQLRRVMKLTAILLTVACIHVSAHSYSQTVSFSGKNVPLPTVLASIEKQTGFSFFFNYALIKGTKPVTLDIKDLALDDALRETLKGQALDFYKSGKTIFIVKKEGQSFLGPSGILGGNPKQLNVTGRITNESGEPLAGASVYAKAERKGTITDQNGNFELKIIASDEMLIVSYTGYQQQQVPVDGQAVISVKLKIATASLDEMQVIGYGHTTQRFATGDVTTIKGEDISKQPVDNPLLALEGQVPGLIITQADGMPGSGVTVRIQGQNSIANGSDPLYVIDGVPYSSQLLSSLGGLLGNSGGQVNGIISGAGNPMSFINPSDIESIAVLKDADATAIYGSRAANGAILITTKKGKLGQTKLDINAQEGMGQVGRMLHQMNTSQYLLMRNEALRNDGRMTSPTDYDINGFWDTTRNTDWQKKLIGNIAQYTNLNASVSGGTLNSQYFIGATYHRQSSVNPSNFADQKGSVHFSMSNVSVNQKLHIQLSGSYLLDKNQLPAAVDLTSIALTLAPDAPALYNADGSLNWMLNSSGSATWNNPVASTSDKYTSNVNNLIANAVFSYQVIPGLDIKSNFGYTNLRQNETAISPLIALKPQIRPFAPRVAQYGNSAISSWIVEPQVLYKKLLGQGQLEVMIGTTIQQNNNNLQQVQGTGYNSDAVLLNIASATTLTAISSIASEYKYNALFGRLNYNLGGKYLIDLTARRDGSSRFGPASQFHNFSALGVGWIFSQENWTRNNLPWMSFGKLRSSYGTTGNDQIGDYSYLALYNPFNVGIPYQGASGLVTTALENPNLQWEETKKLQIALDFGFFKDRLLLSSTYYRNRSSNQLLSYLLPITTGFSTITRNFPAVVQNAGLEFTINTTNFKTKNFSWSSSINITIPHNTLVAFPNLAQSSYKYSLAIGRSISGTTTLFKFAGVNDTTGQYEFYDYKGNRTYNPDYSTDVTDTIKTDPRFYGGFENKLAYKGFTLDFLFQFTRQVGQIRFFAQNFLPGQYNVNQTVDVLQRWQKPGDIAPYQRYNSNYALSSAYFYAGSSNIAYGNTSYMRLTNCAISYQLPKQATDRLRMQSLRIFLQGQNIFTITPAKDLLNPENGNNSVLPYLRVLTAGVQADF